MGRSARACAARGRGSCMHLVRPVRLETEHQQARARRHGKLDGKRQSRDSVMKPEKSGVISTNAVPVAQDRNTIWIAPDKRNRKHY